MKKWLRILTNKYLIATVIFIVVLVFIDDYSLHVSSRLKKQVSALEQEEQQLRDAIVADSLAAVQLRSSLDAKEHYGRENYYMKRADEDIFVIK